MKAASPVLLRLEGIGKSFGPTRVLEDVSFELRAGDVHVLAGENGAGKSTLIKILAGIHTDFEGTITLEGRRVRFSAPPESNQAGISVIHQEMSLVDAMSVADNINLGREPTRGAGWWLDRRALTERALRVCRELDLEFGRNDLGRSVEQFPLSVKNRIEIAKALGFEARIIVMDEPTSALTQPEVERLFGLIEALKARGCGIIYISHRMEEIYRLADRITVLRDGRLVGTATRDECPPATLVRWMIGRELAQHFPPRRRPETSVGRAAALDVRGFRVSHPDAARPDLVKGVSFAAARGEIVGLAGLQGSGSSELLRGLFGAYGPCEGEVLLDGESYQAASPRSAIARGLAYVTGDRQDAGLVPGMSVEQNITLAALPRFSPGGILRPARERAAAADQVQALGLRLASLTQPVATLSGGNQQKAVLAKWLETEPGVLLLDEPTRGVDVGAKHEIYALMNQWTAEGKALVMISTEMTELLGLCDRILVLHRGSVTAEFGRADATRERILAAAMGAAKTEDDVR